MKVCRPFVYVSLFCAGFLTSGCDRSPTTVDRAKLYLHWFTIGTEQEFVPLQSSKISLGEEFDSGQLKGKILRDTKGLHATLEAAYGLSTGKFRNYVELDKLFGPNIYDYSGAIHVTYFVLSSNSDSKRFYAEMMEGGASDDGPFPIDLETPLFVDPEPLNGS